MMSINFNLEGRISLHHLDFSIFYTSRFAKSAFFGETGKNEI